MMNLCKDLLKHELGIMGGEPQSNHFYEIFIQGQFQSSN